MSTSPLDSPEKNFSRLNILGRRLHGILDSMYLGAGYAAAACILMILGLVLVQIVTRYAGVNVPGLTTYAGYLMACSTFLGLSHTLMRGAHIRIETIAKVLGKNQKYMDLFAFAVAAAVACWFAWYCTQMVFSSFELGDVSTDLDSTPLWIPQLAMAAGTFLFAVALLDNFLTLLLTGTYRIKGSAIPL